ncbi:DNA-binding GntR family transcriptional regulator [Paenibacillus endophyticus]|uniref:DNA-binding GntR family transcriptional regulator n=1 Tax=Paenibacillus endophyticus TaxID=1294268 RepID=A0A7W5GA26_9BACL|nr:GntR family transcriptional regulator [Paenibacillus endophyticus]MBB3151557.1 DNA-binding GntR family transcriptional regulator [Paenibacillus endophyticus]
MLDNIPITSVSSISEQVFTAIKKDILAGDLQPGARLLVLEIAKKFNISQAPVREALERLKSAGYITSIPNKGSVVSTITSKEIKDIFELREIMEGFAVRKSMQFLDEDDFCYLERIIRHMHAAHEQKDILNILELDMEFHGFFYKRCDNHMILELWTRMRMKVMRFMAISNRHYSTDGLADWHLRLVEVLREGNSELAEKTFIEHMHSYKSIHLN